LAPIDSSVSGSQFGASGSPLLAHFIQETAQDVPHPTNANRTLWDARNDDGPFVGPPSAKNDNAAGFAQTKAKAGNFATADDLGVSPLGSGSDYTVFLQRSGVSMSLDTLFASFSCNP
jgi:N-acetylated-alpha-linked acidic dipeptidase